MQTIHYIESELKKAFTAKQSSILSKVIVKAQSELVKSDDFNELKDIVKELAEAQKRTEIKMEELAEAQKRTEIKVEELAEAQRLTESEIQELVHEHKKTREQVGGLSATVGYILEDRSYAALPGLLKRDFGIAVAGKIHRRHVKDNKGGFIEINIIGEASRDGREITIIGEGKSQFSKNGVDAFIKKKLKRLEGVYEDIFPVIVTYMISEPDVEEYAKERGIKVYYSHDLA